MVVFYFLVYVFGVPTPDAPSRVETFWLLLDVNGHNLWRVHVLNCDVDWHGVLPLPSVYFFTATRSFALLARGL